MTPLKSVGKREFKLSQLHDTIRFYIYFRVLFEFNSLPLCLNGLTNSKCCRRFKATKWLVSMLVLIPPLYDWCPSASVPLLRFYCVFWICQQSVYSFLFVVFLCSFLKFTFLRSSGFVQLLLLFDVSHCRLKIWMYRRDFILCFT